MFNRTILFPVAMICLLASAPAHAVCGDVNGDGNKTSSDALAVLRSAVGQPVNLQCESGPTLVRYFNDFNCSGNDAVSTLDFNGYEFSASTDDVSDFQTVDVHLVTEMHVELCGGDLNFSGQQVLLPGRRYEVFVVLADPEVYTQVETPAFLIFYDIGSSEALLTSSEPAVARSEAGVMFGGNSTR